MGFSDIGCYGSEIPTPNIDRLAAEGIRFTQFYNTGRCCPTRAALLTGLYPHQAGIGHMIDDYAKAARAKLNSPAYTTRLNDRCVTIAELLGANGYETMMSGKWHVGSEREAWPDRRGFHRSFTLVGGAMNYFGNGIQHTDGEKVMQLQLNGEPWEPPTENFYATNAFTDHAVQFLTERKEPQRPFFLYLAYNAPHWPLHALPEDVAKYRGKYRAGFGKLREARLAKQKAMKLFPETTPVPPRDPQVKAWPALSAEEKDELDLRMAIYAAQMDCMDRNIGRVLETLRQLAVEQNTLVLFLSDNGGCHELINRGPTDAAIGTRESYTSYRRGWAQVSNTPFHLYKHWTHEGGIAAPLIARWPAQIKAAGSISSAVGHVMDLMATALDVAGLEYPRTFTGRPVTALQGISLLPAFRGEALERKEPLFWEHEGNRAVRSGKWKLVSRFPGDWELYDLEADRTETRNLAGEQPDFVKELAAQYDAWALKCDVRPWALTKD